MSRKRKYFCQVSWMVFIATSKSLFIVEKLLEFIADCVQMFCINRFVWMIVIIFEGIAPLMVVAWCIVALKCISFLDFLSCLFCESKTKNVGCNWTWFNWPDQILSHLSARNDDNGIFGIAFFHGLKPALVYLFES